jgi:outer membrane protein TolC
MRGAWIVRIVLVAVALGSFGAAGAAQERLTLAQAVARALEANPDLAIDVPGQAAARSEFEAARAGYLPRLDLEQSYLAGNNPVFVFGTLLTQHRFTAANFALPALNSPSSIDNLQTRITLQQPIWDFGRTRLLRGRAHAGVLIAEQSHADHVRQVLLAVYDAYYSAALAREALQTARVALRSAEAVQAQARARVESGLAVEADLLRSHVYLSAAKQQEIQAQGQLEATGSQLNRLMGDPLETPLGEVEPLAPARIALPLEASLLTAQKKQRPDYQRLLTEVREAELAVSARQREFHPMLTGFSSWEADNPSLKGRGGSNWTAGITLRWNVFAGGADAAQLEAARHRLEQKRRQLAAAESAMALEIRKAMIQCRAAEQQVEVARSAEVQSEESLRILKNRYDAGLATMTDLLSAETARSGARTALAEALYRHRLSFAQLEYAAGVLTPTSAAMSLQ